jgi:hypothetical protein
MIQYSDFTPSEKPTAVIGGKLGPVNTAALHALAVNAMALAVAMPSDAPTASAGVAV